MGLRIPSLVLISTPAIEATPDYATGDLLGPKATKLAGVCLQPGGSCILESLTICDLEEVAIDMEVHFWGRNPTANISSADNAAFAVSDAEVTASHLGYVAITGTDYKDIGGQKVVTYKSLGLLLTALTQRKDLNPTGVDIWYNMIARGAANYGSTGDLTLKFGFMQH